MYRLFALRNARLYLLGQTISLFGDTVLWLAMGIWVKSLSYPAYLAYYPRHCFVYCRVISRYRLP